VSANNTESDMADDTVRCGDCGNLWHGSDTECQTETAMRFRVAAAMHTASGGESLVPFSELRAISPHWHETLVIQADAAVSECTEEIERRLVGRTVSRRATPR
jgi:hypothetical protein